MSTSAILATMLLSTPAFDWEVESAWIDNVSTTHIRNGVGVSPTVLPSVSIFGNKISITDVPIGISTTKKTPFPSESRLVTYQIFFKIRWVGSGTPPNTGLTGSFSYEEYAVAGGLANLNSGSSASVTSSVEGVSKIATLLETLAGPLVNHTYIDGSTTFSYGGGGSAPSTRFTDSSGPYWILSTGGGFLQEHDIDFYGVGEGAGVASEVATRMELTQHDLRPVSPN